jgi:hypothetical protein
MPSARKKKKPAFKFGLEMVKVTPDGVRMRSPEPIPGLTMGEIVIGPGNYPPGFDQTAMEISAVVEIYVGVKPKMPTPPK